MKGLSIKQKAKAYDKAIEGIQKYVKDDYGCIRLRPEDIFPELKESEDERIRKHLKAVVKEYDMWAERGLDMNDVLAWLEKQGKQKETLCDKCKKTQPSHSCQDITALGRCALEKQGEQKLTEFEKAVKQVMEEAIECGDTHNLKADAEMLLSLVQNSAWSEDDELHIRELESLVKQVWTTAEHENDKDTIHKMSDLSFFLKTLKPQPKQEWSEEDGAMWTEISDLLWEGYKQSGSKFSWDDIRNWVNSKLKSLRPQKQWNPSDEQIKAVKEAACYSSVFSEKTIDNLISLSKDLKKLKG